jgi:hypothetical protein
MYGRQHGASHPEAPCQTLRRNDHDSPRVPPVHHQPGKRDEFNALFEKLIPDLEGAGQHIHGQFRDAKDPNKLVWLRGYDEHGDARQGAARLLRRPGVEGERDAVNATLVDIGDVRLLKPVDEPPSRSRRR